MAASSTNQATHCCSRPFGRADQPPVRASLGPPGLHRLHERRHARSMCHHRQRGHQEETTWLGVPCITLRPNTERPITITEGTNVLATPETLDEELNRVFLNEERVATSIELLGWEHGRTVRGLA